MQLRLAILTLVALCYAPLTLWAAETKDIKFQIKNTSPVVFSHEIHLKKYNNNCKVCHNAIFNLKQRRHYTMADMEKTKSCGACHSGVKAFSVADDKACFNCHAGTPHNIKYSVKAGDVNFNHDLHISKTKGQCHACHNGRTITGKEGRVTMAEMEKGRTCGACHNGSRAFTVVGNCGNCHKGLKPHDIEFKPKGIQPAVFSHDNHLKKGMLCKECHTQLFKFKAGAVHYSMAEMAKGKSCGGCHNGKRAFTSNGECNKCHKGFNPGDITFKTGKNFAKFSHEFHLGMYKCTDCHTKLFPYEAGAKHSTMRDMELGKSCGACHNGKDAFTSAGSCDVCHFKK